MTTWKDNELPGIPDLIEPLRVYRYFSLRPHVMDQRKVTFPVAPPSVSFTMEDSTPDQYLDYWDNSNTLFSDPYEKTKTPDFVTMRQSTKLYSLIMDQDNPWEEENTAVCRASHYMVQRNRAPAHSKPHEKCSCGYYGYFLPPADGAVEYLYGGTGNVLAVIEVHGEVVLHPLGVRAEKAKILAVSPSRSNLFKTFSEGAKALLRLHYPTVRQFPSASALTAEYPPQDVEPLIGAPPLFLLREHHLRYAIDQWRYLPWMEVTSPLCSCYYCVELNVVIRDKVAAILDLPSPDRDSSYASSLVAHETYETGMRALREMHGLTGEQ